MQRVANRSAVARVRVHRDRRRRIQQCLGYTWTVQIWTLIIEVVQQSVHNLLQNQLRSLPVRRHSDRVPCRGWARASAESAGPRLCMHNKIN